jgi:hypothetical protein
MKLKLLTVSVAMSVLAPATLLADPVLSSVSVGAQSPATILPGQTATYPLTVVKSGVGSVDAYLSISALPAGASAVFFPSMLAFIRDKPHTLTSVLTISTTASTPAGTYPFVVTAQHGSSKKFVTTTNTLVIGNSPRVPIQARLSIQLLPERTVLLSCEATAELAYNIQATTDLGLPVWTTIATQVTDANGMFSFIDADATNYPARFYRTWRPY